MAISYPVATFNISNTLGVDVTDTYPSYSLPGSAATGTALFYPEYNNPTFAVGTHILGGSNTEYVLCLVGTAGSINQYDMVNINSVMTAIQMSSTQATAPGQIGFLQAAGVAGSLASTSVNFAWIAIRGDTLTVNTGAAVTGGATALYAGTTPGTLGTASASTLLLAGVGNPNSVSAATTMAIIATFPRNSSF